jgi:polysaccharide chain length determinant protein (PEP-CTERM system associated)
MHEIMALVFGYARAAWRRRWVVMCTAWLIALGAWGYILTLPDRYEAYAKVFVDARTALKPVLEGIAIQEDYGSQLTLVREALLSKPQLMIVVEAMKTDFHVTTPVEMDEVAGTLQENIKIYSETPENAQGPQGQRDTIYSIVYEDTDRKRSEAVVRTLLANFEQGTVSGNRSGAAEARGFLDTQIADLEKRLQDAEGRLADFKKRNIGMIPGERGDYFSRTNQEMEGLQKAETDLAVAISRRGELQRQLSNARAYLPGTTGGAAGAPADITLRTQQAEQRLEELLLRYTPRHPEVIELQRTIAELKEREAKELAELQRGGPGTGAIRSLSVNPVYQQIQSQLNSVQVEIASHQGAAEQHRREIANLRRFVDQAPEVEQELTRLNRDYTVTKQQYEQMVARREQAKVSDDAARSGIVRFKTIEPPTASTDPVSPKRGLLFAAALAFAVGAGLLVAVLPQLLTPTFGDVVPLEKLGLPVLGAISAVRSLEERRQRKSQIRSVVLASVALLAVAGVLYFGGQAGTQWLLGLVA